MQLIRKLYSNLLVLVLSSVYPLVKVQSQYMPVVYDRTYGEGIAYQHTCPVTNGEVALIGNNDGVTTVTWIGRDGKAVSSRTLAKGFESVNNTYHIGSRKLLILGQSRDWLSKKKDKGSYGRFIVTDETGEILKDVLVGETGSELFCGQQLKDGSVVLGGYEPRPGGVRAGMLVKIDPSGKVVYKYVSDEGGPCIGFDVLGSSREYIHAAFTAEEGSVSAIVRLDSNGKPVFVTKLPEPEFQLCKMITAEDDHIFLIGNSQIAGGRVVKIRPEGDIIFSKEIVPASSETSLQYLSLAKNGNVLVGGNATDKSYYSLLRNDGTDLQKYILKGAVSGMEMDPMSGESVVVGFDSERARGTIIGLSKDGRQIYQKATDGNFDQVHMTTNGIFLTSRASGRVCMLSASGELLFDRYAIEDDKKAFEDIMFTSNGDILFKDMKNRLIKLGHGLYVSDVKINKPVNGYTTAIFTVTLTGYPTTDQGAPIPVRVEYLTQDGTANKVDNYTPVKGSLSFVPSNDGTARHMIKQDVEVPVKANNLMEGRKMFELHLANVEQSYLVKPIGVGDIEDQEVLVKLMSTRDGLEGAQDVVYELGIFKTNGEPLINATGSEIIVEGVYGKGTADNLDFDMGVSPRINIGRGAASGKFNVKTLEDTRYELPKSVVIDFRKIYAINDANINFESSMLSATGTIVDQPAHMAISSLGDHGRMNNIVSGFFKVSLLRASDGALLTNATGGDIAISCSVNSQTTAEEGKDFVFTNRHDLRIWGDGNRSAINLNGIILHNPENGGVKKLVVGIDSVKKPDNTPEILISPTESSAGFSIVE
ncbi:MAG: Calx-beta domain-containing protein [Dysgonomonas sp.]